MTQGNIIRQETKFSSTHIFVGTSIPITETLNSHWSLGDGSYLLWGCKFVWGLDKLEFGAFLRCWFFVRPTIDLLGRFFFTFNFNDIPLFKYLCLSSFMFFMFFCWIVCALCALLHFEVQSLNVECIKCFHMCVSVHCLMSIIGPEGVLCALWFLHK
jgi:hypothetical protein